MEIKRLERAIKELELSLMQQNKSKFSCLECENQHQEILDWLIELRDYEYGKIGKNLENPNISGYLSLDDAIEHTKDVICNAINPQIINEHKKLLIYLQKLKKYRQNNDPQKII